jgi:hypothetical protein
MRGGQPLVTLSHGLGQLTLGEVALAAVYSLQPGSIDCNQLTAKRIKAAAQNHKFTEHLPESSFVLSSKVSDSFEVWLQLPHQPNHFQITVCFRFQSSAGAHPA